MKTYIDAPEVEFVEVANERGVYGCLRVMNSKVAAHEASCDTSNKENVRQYLNRSGATLLRGLGGDIQSAAQKDIPSTTSSKCGRKRSAPNATSTASKKSRATNVIAPDDSDRDRIHNYLVTSNFGVSLGSHIPIRQLLEALRGAVKCTPNYIRIFFFYATTDINI